MLPQAPFKTQLPCMVAAAAPTAALTAVLCANGFLCAPARTVAVQTCAGFLLPAVAVYTTERRSRARFLLTYGARGGA